jgi:NADH-quinone oxidoreductase subunit G
VWWLKSKKSVCNNCSTGCSINVDQNNDEVFRLKPRENQKAQGYYMCDEGRFGWKYIHSDQRLQMPEERIDGRVVSREWDGVLPSVKTALTSAIQRHPKSVAVVFSPWMTVEEAYLLAKHVKSLSTDVTLALLPTRMEGEDDTYPKDVHGNPVEPVKFTIRAEKAPNRRGVEAVLKHFQGSVIPAGDVLAGVAGGRFDSLYLVEADPKAQLTEQQADGLAKAKLLIVQGLLASPATQLAHFVLAAGSFAERDGTVINHAGLTQMIQRALRGPGDSRADNRILWELTGRTGLFNAPALRKEIAGEIPVLAALGQELGELGVFLTPQPAMA